MTRKITQRQKYQAVIVVLCELREKRGMSQREANKALGRSVTYLSKIETGERRIDLIETMEVLDLYGVPFSQFWRRVSALVGQAKSR